MHLWSTILYTLYTTNSKQKYMKIDSVPSLRFEEVLDAGGPDTIPDKLESDERLWNIFKSAMNEVIDENLEKFNGSIKIFPIIEKSCLLNQIGLITMLIGQMAGPMETCNWHVIIFECITFCGVWSHLLSKRKGRIKLGRVMLLNWNQQKQ